MGAPECVYIYAHIGFCVLNVKFVLAGGLTGRGVDVPMSAAFCQRHERLGLKDNARVLEFVN